MYWFFWIFFIVLFSSCSPEEKNYNIAALLSGEGRIEKVKGFEKGLKDLGIKNYKIQLFMGDNSLKTLYKLAKEILRNSEKFDLVITGGSLEAFVLKKENVNNYLPIVILGGTSIKAWGLTQSFSRPTENITGIDNLNAELMEKRIELFSQLFPNIKKVIVFCTPRFQASKRAAKITIEAGRKYGIKVVPLYVKDVRELEYVISHMKEDGFGAIIMTPCYYTDNFLTHYILHYASFYKIQVFCHGVEFVRKGCPVGYGTSGFKQGYQAAILAYRILKGIPVELVPFERAYSPKLVLNEKALYDLDIDFNKRFMVMVDEVIK